MQSPVRFTVLIAIASSVSIAADWDKKPFPQWKEDVAYKLVTNSPWARPKRVPLTWHEREDRPLRPEDVPGNQRSPIPQGAGPLGGVGLPRQKLPNDADLLVRWASALPVRQATALYRAKQQRDSKRNVTELVEARVGGYVVEIFGIPSEVGHRGPESVAALVRGSAYLLTKSGRTIRPSDVKVNIASTTMSVLVHFSDAEPLTLEDKEVEFFADVQIFQVREKFKLDDMMYGGGLAL